MTVVRAVERRWHTRIQTLCQSCWRDEIFVQARRHSFIRDHAADVSVVSANYGFYLLLALYAIGAGLSLSA